MFLFLSGSSEHAERLLKIVKSKVPVSNFEICLTIESLLTRMKKPGAHSKTVVILASNKKELSDLHDAKELLFGAFLILILPDTEKKTISLGHALRPRYLTQPSGDLIDVGAILEKRFELIGQSQIGQDQNG